MTRMVVNALSNCKKQNVSLTIFSFVCFWVFCCRCRCYTSPVFRSGESIIYKCTQNRAHVCMCMNGKWITNIVPEILNMHGFHGKVQTFEDPLCWEGNSSPLGSLDGVRIYGIRRLWQSHTHSKLPNL